LNSKSSKLNTRFKIRECIFLFLPINFSIIINYKFNFSKIKMQRNSLLGISLPFKEKNCIKYSKLFEEQVFRHQRFGIQYHNYKNAVPILRKARVRHSGAIYLDYANTITHGSSAARILTMGTKKRVWFRSRALPPRGAQWHRERLSVSVRFHGNNVRHWRNRLFPTDRRFLFPPTRPSRLRVGPQPPSRSTTASRCQRLPPPRLALSRPSATATFGRRRPAETDDGAAACGGARLPRATALPFPRCSPSTPSPATRSSKRVAPRVVSDPNRYHPPPSFPPLTIWFDFGRDILATRQCSAILVAS